jgi:predicted nucleic acid-binding protein
VKQYLLDTGPLSAYLRGRPLAISLISPWIANDEVDTSVVVYGEVIEYIRSDPQFAVRRSELRRLLKAIRPHPLTYRTLERYADVRRAMRRPYGSGLIGDIDTLIAATALERNLTLVTTDSDFLRVSGLRAMVVTVR